MEGGVQMIPLGLTLGFLSVTQLGDRGGGELPAAYNSKTINDNETKLVGVVKDNRLIKLM